MFKNDKVRSLTYYYQNRERILARHYRKRQRIKVEVFTRYSGGHPKCKVCGETDLRVLCIDHINGGGTQERKRIKQGGEAGFYYRLKRMNYPEGYQVLCANCNLRKEVMHELYSVGGEALRPPLNGIQTNQGVLF